MDSALCRPWSSVKPEDLRGRRVLWWLAIAWKISDFSLSLILHIYSSTLPHLPCFGSHGSFVVRWQHRKCLKILLLNLMTFDEFVDRLPYEVLAGFFGEMGSVRVHSSCQSMVGSNAILTLQITRSYVYVCVLTPYSSLLLDSCTSLRGLQTLRRDLF